MVNFFKILDEYPEIQQKVIVTLSKRIYTKATTSKNIVNQKPAVRILYFMSKYKKQAEVMDIIYPIPFTRQEIAILPA